MSSDFFDVQSSMDTIFTVSDDEQVDNLGTQTNIDGKNDCTDSLVQELEHKLLNEVVNSEEEAYNLYCAYGHAVGFSVRRGKRYYYQGTKLIRTKSYFCSKQGSKSKNEGISNVTFNKLETRTECTAMANFKVDKEGHWQLNNIVRDHNHELAKDYEKHLLRSARNVTKDKGTTLMSMVDSGIAIVDAYSYLNKESGGVATLGFTKKDAYNHIDKERRSNIQKGDAQNLVNHFKTKVNEEGMYYWDVELDDKGRMMNFFWRDGRSRIDYDFFGDVVVFDTTYRKNCYDLVCAPFIGVNHHWQTICFGCAFLSNEKTCTFEWAFKTFLESMGNKSPITFMTDQAQAIMNAVGVVFPNCRHRLCLWHISQNAPSHLLNFKTAGFQELFYHCLSGCETEDEFETTWSTMIRKYNFEGHSWLKRLYGLRHKWCTALNNDAFSAGFKSTSRSEGTNNILKEIGSVTTSLTKFVLEFELKIREWRQSEADADFMCKQGRIPIQVKESTLLQQAARYYTHKLYKMFDQEFIGVLATSFVVKSSSGDVREFEVSTCSRSRQRASIVHLDVQKMEVKCTCKKFESMGLLCTHALGALRFENIGKIPDMYLLRCWSQEAKRRVNEVDQEIFFQMSATGSQVLFTNSAMRYAFDMITRSQSQERARILLWQGLENTNSKLDEFFKNHLILHTQFSIGTPTNEGINCEQDPDIVLNPIRTRGNRKRRGERIKGHFEKRKKGSPSQGTQQNVVNNEAQEVNVNQPNARSSQNSPMFSLTSLMEGFSNAYNGLNEYASQPLDQQWNSLAAHIQLLEHKDKE